MNIEKTVPCRDGGREYRMVNFLFCMLGLIRGRWGVIEDKYHEFLTTKKCYETIC